MENKTKGYFGTYDVRYDYSYRWYDWNYCNDCQYYCYKHQHHIDCKKI